ncbi:hypothetical protein AAT19DRAFT_14134 [Rhodotorula toruloides]|uniref:F-box domain-containing protein n=2 Tax=Rhodotorula toruloides TaxID=5286 RepID=A0A2T0AAU0_RHOTO|nr:hypothetical protein AAT19DRAFT_14134 [Rhodotorula toruloides]
MAGSVDEAAQERGTVFDITAEPPTMPPPAATTTILSLPPELHEHIFSFLSLDKAGKRHICRAFLPFTRRNLFRTANLSSARSINRFHHLLSPARPKSAARLANSTQDDKDLGLMVKTLGCTRIDYVECPHDDDAELTVAMRKILSLVRECTEMTLSGSGLLRVLLPSKRGGASLPHLTTLRLVELDSEYDDLFNMSRLSRLNRFRSLRHLDMHIDLDFEDEIDVAKPVKARPLVYITSLHLDAGPSLDTPAARNFISHLSNLERLHLELEDLVDLGSFLQACPTQRLTELNISFVDWFDIDDEDSFSPIDADLARFTNLQHLILGRDTFSRSCELFPILAAHLHALRSLEFIEECDLVASKLIAYVAAKGGGTSRALERVKVDAFYARADPIPSEVPNNPDVRAGTFKFSERWHLPAWTSDFTLADAKELVAVGQEVGVKIEGRLLQAIEVEALREREEDYLQERREEVLYSLRALFEVEDEDGSLKEAEERWAAAEREWEDQQDEVLYGVRGLYGEDDE